MVDPSQHVPALSTLLVSVVVFVSVDFYLSWVRARAKASDLPLPWLCGPPVRAGLRAGLAAGLFGLFDLSRFSSFAAPIAAAAVFLVSTAVISDALLPRFSKWLGRAGAAGGGPSQPGIEAPDADSRAGLSVVASRAERLRDTPVSRIMVPRKSIVGCDSSATVREAAALMTESGLSRVVVYGKTIDRPLGLAHVKDLLPLVYEGQGPRGVEGLLRPLVLTPSSTRGLELLHDFQRLKRRLAVVRDLHGERTLGLVTTEDILEEMVGEIQDRDEDLAAALEAGVALVRGDIKAAELIEGLGVAAGEEVGDASVGDLVKSLLGREPSKGDVVLFGGLRMKVEETVNGDVWMVRVDRIE